MPRKRATQETQPSGIFNGLDILVFPALIAPKRLRLFESQIRKMGGGWLTLREVKDGRKSSFVVVDETLAQDGAKVRRLFEESNIEVTSDVVTTKWLSDCLKSGTVEPKDKYGIGGAENIEECESASNIAASSRELRSSCETEAKSCETEAKSCETEAKSCETEAKSCETEAKSCETEAKSCETEAKSCETEAKSCETEAKSCETEAKSCETEAKLCEKSDVNCLGASGAAAGSSSTEDVVSAKRPKVDVRVSMTSTNDVIIAELQKLADAFTSKGDTWRAHGYNKAISAIRRHDQPINSYEDAVKLPGVGSRMAEKVWEILERGSLRKVAEVCGDEKMKIVELFTGVWGAGPSTAESWYKQGYRTLEDLKQNAMLTKQQQVGLKHYDDFADRMNREEVERIGAVVEEVVLAVEPSVEVILVGSYRRGKQTCGDADVLICRPDHIKPGSILPRLLESLKEKNFITDDLVHIEEQKNQRKYLGVCRLPGENQKHRRLDIFVAPRSELAPALMHYTGSALFNRSVRLDAAKKGMSLSEHCLTTDVIRQGSTIISEGRVIPTLTEAAIFEALGMKYLEPPERNY